MRWETAIQIQDEVGDPIWVRDEVGVSVGDRCGDGMSEEGYGMNDE